MNYKYRLISIIIIIIIYWIIDPWLNFSYIIFNFEITSYNYCVLLLLLYILLEYRIYFYKKAHNKCYYFFYWFIYLIVFVSLFIITRQAFHTQIVPEDFLINMEYLKVQIKYTTEYFLYYMDKHYFRMLDKSGFHDKDVCNIFFQCSRIIYMDQIAIVKNMVDLNKLLTHSTEITMQVYFSPFPFNYKEESNIIINFVRIVKIATLCKIICYTIPNLLLIKLPKVLLTTLFDGSFRQYSSDILRETFFDFRMTPIEYYDFCTSYMHWLLKIYPPGKILEDVIKYLFGY